MYGSGVYNFFKFFKWSMGLNLMMMLLTMLIVIPESFNADENPVCQAANFSLDINFYPTNLSDECCSQFYLEKQALEKIHVSNNIHFFEDVGNILIDLVFGDGWMEYTYLYYGFYSNNEAWDSYQTAVAYFFVMF